MQLLRRLGFAEARRTQQYCGDGAGDVVFGDDDYDTRVHLEVKFGCGGMGMGTALLRNAIRQAEHDSAGKFWVVLWHPPRSQHWMATALRKNIPLTACGDEDVLRLIQWLRYDD